MSIFDKIIEYVNGANTASAVLAVDGKGGPATVKRMQAYFGTAQDGYISGQDEELIKKHCPALTAVKYGTGGSACVKKMQKWLGVTQDGIIGEKTVKALQKKLGVTQDGIWGTGTMKAFQKYLNSQNNAGKLAMNANNFAWASKTSKAKYPGGSPTSAYKAGLNKAFPKRSSWGAAARKGASCDVFVATCVRCAGIDSNFPRGLSPSYLAKSSKFTRVKVTAKTIQDGDIIVTSKHICIHYGGKIKEASHGDFYPMTTNTLSKRLGASGAKVYRAK